MIDDVLHNRKSWHTQIGDVLDGLAMIPDESVHCCVSSPPYWGLRDYGVDGQIGLEKTPQEFIAKLVAVFREVRRVLRADGTLWLNLGSSYASSRPASSVAACGSDGKGLSDSESAGHACRHSGDEPQVETLSRLHGTPDTAPPTEQEQRHCEPTNRDNKRADSSLVGDRSSPSDAPLSTTPSLSGCASDASGPSGAASACPSGLRTSSGDVPPCAGTPACTACIESRSQPSVDRKTGKEVSGSACGDPLCKGRCGICFAYYSMASLQFKPKDLMMMPSLLALALQSDGWYLRSEITWCKRSPMPESVSDRPTTATEKVYLLAKSGRYFYDMDAERVGHQPDSIARIDRGRSDAHKFINGGPGNQTIAKDLSAACHPAGRNLRNYWTDIGNANFKGWTETVKLEPVEVQRELSDGTMRITSSDCPVHGDQPDSVPMALRGGRVADELTRILRKHGRLGPTQEGDSETSDQRQARCSPAESLDCPAPSCAETATPRSNQSSKTGHDPETNPPCKPCDETFPRTVGKSELPTSVGLHPDTPASNTSAGDCGDSPNNQNLNHTAGSDKRSESCEASEVSLGECCCSFYQEKTSKTSHFATFPPDLPARCIRLGTSERGVCPECGAPWVRLVEKERRATRPGQKSKAKALTQKLHGELVDVAKLTKSTIGGIVGHRDPERHITVNHTTGWEPGCDHGKEPIGAIVLDPFSGAATTGLVAVQMGRRYIGLELNPEYAAMGDQRIANRNVAPETAIVDALGQKMLF